MTIKQEKKVLEDFIVFCLTTCSEQRAKKIKGIILNCRKMIGKDLTKLKVKDVVSCLAKLNQSNYKDWTKNDYKKILKRFLKWYYKDLEMLELQGFRGVSKNRAFNHEKINENTLLTEKELETLLRTAKSLKWKALLSFMYEGALRPTEVRNMKWGDLKFENDLCRVHILSRKTKDARKIIVKDCVVHLKRWMDEYQFSNRTNRDYVFPSQHHQDKEMGGGVIPEMLKRICKDAKIRHIFPYLFRHTRLTKLQAKLPEKIVAKFGGHSIETTEIYNHLSNTDVEESMLREIYTTKELTPEQKNKYDIEIEELKKITSKLNGDFLSLLKNPKVTKIISEEESKKMNVNKISKKERELYNSLKKTN